MRPFRVLAAVCCLLIAGCASSGQETETPPDAAAVSTASPTPEPTPYPAPTPVTLVCPSGWDYAGAEYTYDPAEASRDEALSANCGTAAPVTLICPYGWEHAGLEFTYDPDEEERPDARDAHCGLSRDERMIDSVCPDNLDFAGLEFSYDPLEMTISEARDTHCGTRAPFTTECSSAYFSEGMEFTYDPDDMLHVEAQKEYCGRPRSILNSCELLDDDVQAQAKKGTFSIVGNCYFMGVHVWQFDANTGPCSFLGSFSRYDNRGFAQDRLAYYGYSEDPDFNWLFVDCADLDDVFAGDNIVVDAVFVGSYSYETQIGGYNSVPAFEILRVR